MSLMERVSSLSNAHSHGMEKIQALEAERSKVSNERAALEENERKNKEKANQVLFTSFKNLYSYCFILYSIKKQAFSFYDYTDEMGTTFVFRHY